MKKKFRLLVISILFAVGLFSLSTTFLPIPSQAQRFPPIVIQELIEHSYSNPNYIPTRNLILYNFNLDSIDKLCFVPALVSNPLLTYANIPVTRLLFLQEYNSLNNLYNISLPLITYGRIVIKGPLFDYAILFESPRQYITA